MVSNIFYFHLENLGEDETILTHIFPRGWFNHQLDSFVVCDPVVWFSGIPEKASMLQVLHFFLGWKNMCTKNNPLKKCGWKTMDPIPGGFLGVHWNLRDLNPHNASGNKAFFSGGC